MKIRLIGARGRLGSTIVKTLQSLEGVEAIAVDTPTEVLRAVVNAAPLPDDAQLHLAALDYGCHVIDVTIAPHGRGSPWMPSPRRKTASLIGFGGVRLFLIPIEVAGMNLDLDSVTTKIVKVCLSTLCPLSALAIATQRNTSIAMSFGLSRCSLSWPFPCETSDRSPGNGLYRRNGDRLP